MSGETAPAADVHTMCMTRTNIDLDDDLVRRAMARLNVQTKREAVHLALEHVMRPLPTPGQLRSLRGVGWEGDLDEMRGAETEEA